MEIERLTWQGSQGDKLELNIEDFHLLSTVRREVEHQDCEEADAHAGDDEVDGVEQRLPPHGDVEGYVQVGLVTARVKFFISEKAGDYFKSSSYKLLRKFSKMGTFRMKSNHFYF